MLIARKKTPLLLMTLFLLAGACATTEPRQLGDGTVQNLTYSDKGPALVKNSWAEIVQATTGFAAEPDEQFDIPYWWQFALKVKKEGLKSINIYDVTGSQARLLLTDPAPAPQEGEWRGRTSPEKFSREAAPWFFTPGATEHIFKIVLTDRRGEERSLYQPCLHSEEAKKAQVLEVVRLTAPEIKSKPRRISTAPKPPPTEFNVFLPKRPPAPERSYSMSGNKNQQALTVTISPKGEPD